MQSRSSTMQAPDSVPQRLYQARSSLAQAAQMIETGYEQTAVHRLYHACFCAVMAWLTQHEIPFNSHQAVRKQFKKYLWKAGFLSSEDRDLFEGLYAHRHASDQTAVRDYSLGEVHHFWKGSEDFIEKIADQVNLG
ncbi:MAG: HEPN domain-containing protein [Bacteroidota bacterium]